tara:strand:+ start:238 stop:684 length:447 start_codon:yes stop_codon:yes gene_type:complete
MKKINQKELKALITVCTEETNKQINSYNKQLPKSKEYKEFKKELEESNTFNVLELQGQMFHDLCKDAEINFYSMKDMLTAPDKYVARQLVEKFPIKKGFNIRGSYYSSGSSLDKAESIITLANAQDPFPYENIAQFKTEMVKELLKQA